MKVVSWNIHRCFGTDGRYRPERIYEVLRELDADVIALQEADSSLRTDSGEDQLGFLSSRLGMMAVMGPTLNRDYGAYGNAILSRFEIDACEECDLSFRRFEPRGALAVHLKVPSSGGHRLRFVNTHLGLKYWERAFQIDRLLAEFVWLEGEPAIVAGDFNEWFPWTGNNLRLARAFTTASPRLPTFPAHWPRLALDRVFVSGDLKSQRSVARFEVLRTPLTRVASDHLPLLADIEI